MRLHVPLDARGVMPPDLAMTVGAIANTAPRKIPAGIAFLCECVQGANYFAQLRFELVSHVFKCGTSNLIAPVTHPILKGVFPAQRLS